MAYKVIYSADEDCVHARIEGVIDLDMVHEYAWAIIRQLSAHHCLRLLNDVRKASVRLSTVDIYDLPAWIEEAIKEAGVSRGVRRALVVRRDFDDYKFFETVSRNHGHLLEVFADSDATGIFRNKSKARAWLGLTTDILSRPGTWPVPDAQTSFRAWEAPAERGGPTYVHPMASRKHQTPLPPLASRCFHPQSAIISPQSPAPGSVLSLLTCRLSLSSCLLRPHLPYYLCAEHPG